jgi:hypothetical protein
MALRLAWEALRWGDADAVAWSALVSARARCVGGVGRGERRRRGGEERERERERGGESPKQASKKDA